METFPQSFEVYGFTIEVHAGGRRVWPPSFKQFVKDKLDSGDLAVGDVMKTCNVSQSLVYKWRSDVRRAGTRRTLRREECLFSEVDLIVATIMAGLFLSSAFQIVRQAMIERQEMTKHKHLQV